MDQKSGILDNPTQDCIDPKFGLIGRFAIRPEKENNQTCILMSADFTEYIMSEQVEFWAHNNLSILDKGLICDKNKEGRYRSLVQIF